MHLLVHRRQQKSLTISRKALFCLAGGRGFEPRLTESESVVLPLDDPPLIVGRRRAAAAKKRLTLGVLRTSSGFVQADFLTLDFTRIAGHITGFTQGGAQRFIVIDQSARQTMANSAGLP